MSVFEIANALNYELLIINYELAKHLIMNYEFLIMNYTRLEFKLVTDAHGAAVSLIVICFVLV